VPLLSDPSSIFASRTEAGAMVRLQPSTLADALKGSGDAPALILAGTMQAMPAVHGQGVYARQPAS